MKIVAQKSTNFTSIVSTFEVSTWGWKKKSIRKTIPKSSTTTILFYLTSLYLFDSFEFVQLVWFVFNGFFRFSFIVDIVWYFIATKSYPLHGCQVLPVACRMDGSHIFKKYHVNHFGLFYCLTEIKFSIIRLKCQNNVNIVRKLEFSLDSTDKIVERETNRKFAIYLSNGNKIQLDIFDIHMWSSNIIIIHRLFETLSISNFWWPIPIQMKINASKWIKMGKSKNV